MFNVGPGELIIVALVLLIAVGPEQLPGVIRRAGSAIGQVKSMTEGLRSDFMSGLDEIERATDPNAWAASAGPSNVKPQPAKAAEAEPDPEDSNGAEADDDATGPVEDTIEAQEDSVEAQEDSVEAQEDSVEVEDTIDDPTIEVVDTVEVEETAAEEELAVMNGDETSSNGSKPPNRESFASPDTAPEESESEESA